MEPSLVLVARGEWSWRTASAGPGGHDSGIQKWVDLADSPWVLPRISATLMISPLHLSIFVRHQNSDARMTVVIWMADRFERDEFWGGIVVADVQLEVDFPGVGGSRDAEFQHVQDVPQPSYFVLTLHTIGDFDVSGPDGLGQGDGISKSCLRGSAGDFDEYAVLDGLPSGVAGDDFKIVEHDNGLLVMMGNFGWMFRTGCGRFEVR